MRNKYFECWFKTGELTTKPGKILSYAGDGYYWVKNIEKNTIHYCLITEIEFI